MRVPSASLASTLPRDGSEVTQKVMARERLVPYGGQAPVDVYVTAKDDAVICVVLAGWTNRKEVSAAIEITTTTK